jgi:hypothetical protein
VTTPTVRKAAPANPACPDLEVIRKTWRKGGFDTVALMTVTFRNNSDRPIGNIPYNTHYYAATGKVLTKGGEQSFLGKDMIRASFRRIRHARSQSTTALFAVKLYAPLLL